MKFFRKKSAALVPMAEEMYVVNGRNCVEIAGSLKVSKETVYRWSRDGGWEDKRKRHNNVFRATLLTLEAKLESIGEELGKIPLTDDSFAGKADAISKLLGQIVKLRNHYDMDVLKMTVIVMEKFARYVRMQQLPEHQLEAIETAMGGFFETIKKEHA